MDLVFIAGPYMADDQPGIDENVRRAGVLARS